MIKFLAEFASESLSVIAVFYMVFRIIDKKIITAKNMLIMIVASILSSIVYIVASPIIYTLSTTIIYIFAMRICLDNRLYEIMMWFMVAFAIIGMLQIVVILTLPKDDVFIKSILVQIIGQLGVLLLLIVLNKLWDFRKLFSGTRYYYKVIRGALICVFLLIYAASIYSKYDATDARLVFPFIVLFVVGLLYCMHVSYTEHQRYKKLQVQIEDYQTYQPMFEELVNHVRTRQHEFDNQLMAIRALPVTHTDYDSLATALANNTASVMESLQNSTLLKLNLKVLSAFLFSKYQQALKIDVHIGFLVKNSSIATIVPEHELLEIFGILIDNAVEAVDGGDSITIAIDCTDNKIEITSLNKGPHITSEMRERFFQKDYSTKNKSGLNRRGIGLYRLKEIVDKYNGSILLDNELCDGVSNIMFQVKV